MRVAGESVACVCLSVVGEEGFTMVAGFKGCVNIEGWAVAEEERMCVR